MFKKILIANRGEIALRILRSCKELGIKVVTVYSEADKDQLHVKLADESYCIGPARSQHSYLNVSNLLTVATETGCEAIHPGYGFLSENPEFATIVEDLGITFIGPSAHTIQTMGDKAAARKLMIANDIPVVPGSEDVVNSVDEAKQIAEEMGYPVLIKASRGGGGKGMRRVDTPEELEAKFISASEEAKKAFGDGSVYIEKLILGPRHVEVQVLRDNFGNAVHLGERHCSIQRSHQKMIEEAPYTKLTPEKRKEMGEVAVKVAHACDYRNAGTVEFLFDENGDFYFIEMNTRLQVEHPVTEMITGIDLVKEQLRIATGLPLKISQDDIQFDGHAIEVRVNAEDVSKNFMPSTGTVTYLLTPGGFDTRFDSYLYQGAEISPFYDSMIGKIIVKGKTRLEAIRKMRRAIEECIVHGVTTNLPYQYSILHRNDFLRNTYDTGFVEKNHEAIMGWIHDVMEKGDIND